MKWFNINLILPLIVPFIISFICLMLGGILGKMAINNQMCYWQYYKELLNVLLVNGVYSFICITLLISLFYDYKIAKNIIKGMWLIVYVCIILALGSLFLHSLGLVIGETNYTSEERMSMFFWFSGFSILYSIPFKIIIIKRKITN